ncbi:hypothetical protein GSI_01813 [Ganoderma sinense ZZ0214-1]|uniref:Uncharacterized protein n=1 Tax=Ganoderma sinense ZZ0214-1 TaxID=1077348 RepID=A0A2G8SR07_9APHY|nr:hypothetical protein GSI_01813 [Ganoderma sinense ZZ0214-1]
MLVVDRRDDVGAYAPGANRAAVQAELERHHYPHAGAYESTAVPAQVEIEGAPAFMGTKQGQHAAASMPLGGGQVHGIAVAGGVPCITKTPGPAALVALLLERVWGVRP